MICAPVYAKAARIAADVAKGSRLAKSCKPFCWGSAKQCIKFVLGSSGMSARRLRTEACFVVAAIMTTASAAPNGIAGLGSEAVAAPMGDNVTNAQLPISERFRSLDEYLAFLEKTQAPIDKPWYRQIRPGI